MEHREITGAGPWRFSEARSLGVTRRELDGDEFVRVRHGLYLSAAADQNDPDLRIRLAAKLARDRAPLGGWAAARVLEADRLDGLPGGTWMHVFDGRVPWPEGRGELEPLLLCASRDRKIVEVPAMRTLRSELSTGDVVSSGALRITSPARTAFDLARTRTLWGGVIAVDRLLHLNLASPEELVDYFACHRGRLGAAQARKVLTLADGRAESPAETVTRMVWLDAGLPRPDVNAEVRDSAGRFVARVDLFDRRSLLVVEYDGEYHATAAQRSRDSARELALEALGCTVMTVTSVDLSSPHARRNLRRRLVRGYAQATRKVA